MRLSKFLLNTTKDITSEAKLISHQLMLMSGMIKQVSSGVYCWLPLGVKVLDKIKCIIKHELDSINSHEIILPSLQPLSTTPFCSKRVPAPIIKGILGTIKTAIERVIMP